MMTTAEAVVRMIESRDHLLMYRVHRWLAPRWIRIWMVAATRGGDGWLWYALGVVLLVFGGRQGREATWEATAAVGTGVALFIWLKKRTKRRRPCAIAPHCWSTLLPPDQFSFPSGHTITAFSVAVPVMNHMPEAAAGVLFCALSVAASRVLLGMHFLSDVLAGAVIGCLLGALAGVAI
jgi:undecaprenyl-diphosphatase